MVGKGGGLHERLVVRPIDTKKKKKWWGDVLVRPQITLKGR